MSDTRDRLLDAAAAVVIDGGMKALTLDAVAARAEVSKGGLLYHFPSRRALVEGLVRRWVARFEAELQTGEGGAPGDWTRAYVRASEMPGLTAAERHSELGMLGALLQGTEELEYLRERWVAWQARLESDGVDPAAATVARLAADGLWLSDVLDAATPTGDLRRQVLELIDGLLEGRPGG